MFDTGNLRMGGEEDITDPTWPSFAPDPAKPTDGIDSRVL